MSNGSRSKLSSFRYKDGEKVSKPKIKIVTKNKSKGEIPTGLEDLNPSLNKDLVLLFVGFNPGVESSKTQHHYAHHTNLFWKLFNDSRLLLKVLESQNIDPEQHTSESNLLKEIIQDGISKAKPIHDFRLIEYSIGFTDLVLRCTRSAQELSMVEKMNNVPRLLEEFKMSKASNIIIVGKGIWEIIIKYIQKNSHIKVKAFTWGKQAGPYCEWISEHIECDFNLYVFPNTSGLVTNMKYNEKLALWGEVLN